MDRNYEIIELPKENGEGVAIPLVTKSDSFYDLKIEPMDSSGCKISLIKKRAANNDIKRREVRINLGYFFNREDRRW